MFNYNKIYLVLATVASVNLFYDFLPKPALFFLGGILFILASAAYGDKAAPKSSLIVKISFGAIFVLGIAALVGAIFFYLFSLNELAIITSLIIIFWLTRGFELKKLRLASASAPPLGQLIYYILAGLLICTAYKFQSSELIESPWKELPCLYLSIFFIATVVLILLLSKKSDKNALGLHFFIFFSIAAFIYSLGYGFDQFVHEATQKYILEYGTISPKPFQYIGLYSINIFLHQITALPIETLNKFLLPVLTIFIAPIGYYCLKKKGLIKSSLPVLALLLLPLSVFIVTTPQGVANLFLLVLIFCAMTRTYLVATRYVLVIVFAILFIHPITGIISLIYLALLKLRFKKIIFLTGVLALPLAFFTLSFKLGGRVGLHFKFVESFKNYFDLLALGGIQQNYNLWLDLFYLARSLILPIIIIVSIWTARRYKKQVSQYPLYLFWAATLSFFLTSVFIDFYYLINYEQKNYPERIFYISLLFLAPYLIFAVQKICSRLTSPLCQGEVRGGLIYKTFFVLLFAFLITSNFYLTYPRSDNYQNDKGKNITVWMTRAVNKIKSDAGENDYVVLTDQAVSTAALRVDGFKKYYKTPLGEIFYYPIPTGGPLYHEFLNLIYNNAGYRAVESARTLTGAKRV
ncbi:hypothetical protein KJ885_00415, partial [Patescibacteria group bacterium]|nr:hypothetical protein [Patescibacteria group bacterium]